MAALHEYIISKASGILSDESSAISKKVRKTADALISWCVRNSVSIDDAPIETVSVMRVFKCGDSYYDIPISIPIRGLVHANPGILCEIDKKFLSELKWLKQSGISDGHILIYFLFMRYAFSAEADNVFRKKKNNGLLINLAYRRIEETVRLAERLKHIDKFGPIVTEKKDGTVVFDYDGTILKQELVKRGVWRLRR